MSDMAKGAYKLGQTSFRTMYGSSSIGGGSDDAGELNDIYKPAESFSITSEDKKNIPKPKAKLSKALSDRK